jgi:prevent-host-death family protein
MDTIPLSYAKARLSEIADDVDRTHRRVQITKNGRSYVVLMSADDLESLEATLELLSDPAAMERVRQARADIAKGDVVTGEKMAVLMQRRRQNHKGG